MSSFTSCLLSHDPPITGLDESIVVPARRLHLTLGVMSIAEKDSETETNSSRLNSENNWRRREGEPRPFSGGERILTRPHEQKTLGSALTLLLSLQPRLTSLLDKKPLMIPLSTLDIMKPEKNDKSRAHVCFIGPSEQDMRTDFGQRLWSVCGALCALCSAFIADLLFCFISSGHGGVDLIRSEFQRAGFVIDKRALKVS